MKHYRPKIGSTPDLREERVRHERHRALRALRDAHEPRHPDRGLPREERGAEAHAARIEARRVARYEAWLGRHCREA